MWAAPLSLRRLRSLIMGLPTESAFVRAVRPEVTWTQTHELLASLIEVTDRVHLRHLKAYGAKGLSKGIEVPRPREKPKRRKATADDLKKIFGGAIRYVPARG